MSTLGMEIPEDLRLLAAHETEFQAHQFKKAHGISEDHQSTALLKEALAAGQKGKAGIGFKSAQQAKASRPALEEPDLIDKYKEMVDQLKLKEYQLKAKELMGFEEGVGFDHRRTILLRRESAGSPIKTRKDLRKATGMSESPLVNITRKS